MSFAPRLLQPQITSLVASISAQSDSAAMFIGASYLHPAYTVSRNSVKTLRASLNSTSSVGVNVAAFDYRGLSIHEQRTNYLQYSDDFTNAVWTKSGLTAALTATGADGISNSASILTATEADATVAQYGSGSAAGSHVHTVEMRRRTGSGAVHLNNGLATGGAGLGSNMIQNGDFAGSAGWSLSGDLVIAGGKLTKTPGASTRVATTTSPLRPMTPALAYLITFTIDSITAGSVTPRISGSTVVAGTSRTAAGTYSSILVAPAGTPSATFSFTNTSDAIVDDILVQPYCQSVLSLTTDWQRFEIGAVTTVAAAPQPALGIYMATSGDEVDIQFANAQAGTFHTPHIQTAGATATRLVDSISALLSALNISTSGVVTIYGRTLLRQNAPSAQTIFQIDDGTANNRFRLRNTTGAPITFGRVTAGASVDATSLGNMVANTSFGWAVKINFATGAAAACLDGGTVRTVAGGPTSGLTTIRQGGNAADGDILNGYISSQRMLPVYVDDTLLQALSRRP